MIAYNVAPRVSGTLSRAAANYESSAVALCLSGKGRFGSTAASPALVPTRGVAERHRWTGFGFSTLCSAAGCVWSCLARQLVSLRRVGNSFLAVPASRLETWMTPYIGLIFGYLPNVPFIPH
jgi:hypothetical protein